MSVEEQNDREANGIDILFQNIVLLTNALQTQNDILMVILGQLDLKIPDWKTKLDVEKAVGTKIEDCVKLMRGIYGPGKDNKS